jgi:hypothetical protein
MLMSGSFRKEALTHSVVFGSEQRKGISAISDVNFIARDLCRIFTLRKKGNDTSGPFSIKLAMRAFLGVEHSY